MPLWIYAEDIPQSLQSVLCTHTEQQTTLFGESYDVGLLAQAGRTLELSLKRIFKSG